MLLVMEAYTSLAGNLVMGAHNSEDDHKESSEQKESGSHGFEIDFNEDAKF